jgi:hypothetical protein
MKLRIYFYDEYELCTSLELINYSEVYRELDKNRDVCWIYMVEAEELSKKQEDALNKDPNIKTWQIIKEIPFPG